jgi:hypothetical protein
MRYCNLVYNKLFVKILDSSIWLEDMPTRLVWLTLLAAMDRDGFCRFAAVENLAHRARVPIDDTKRAVTVLEAPDTNSSNPANDGRRIERVQGGWIVLNADDHRRLATAELQREQTKERVQRFRERRRNAPVTHHNENATPSEAYAEADTEAELLSVSSSPIVEDQKHSAPPRIHTNRAEVTHLTENPGALHLIARQVVTNTPSETLSELAERIKEQAAKARITYDASAITVALASAQHWHRTHGGLLENHRKQA